ncbi:hypothetical protein CWI38_1273p0020 [Hamiltosporidium tvaerminnensis]|uniref:Uncharacterized protein n=2 Tax=Hamiltosporidium TaxID=1176354 RepID=A0A4Q9L017_9MICR|nr:hypothetical protein LUQ84_000225 [Hamiltosporidium tvaerminnensis]TBT98573.1 hypothetical protein CWI37_1693p0020 [Hamiltosporidium tvaerminnensis]TBT99736.1 hypothetical protein CWI36_1867p0020 [Hamiltosporidium magnivora]TBU00071.1 hypothetical protein CWI39_1798p0020 [Hamiltosporidium magnivora]TBU11310.1 hypothetical protein CWI38_1273p0020 [Hamiltosporidium tvaerminnensis]
MLIFTYTNSTKFKILDNLVYENNIFINCPIKLKYPTIHFIDKDSKNVKECDFLCIFSENMLYENFKNLIINYSGVVITRDKNNFESFFDVILDTKDYREYDDTFIKYEYKNTSFICKFGLNDVKESYNGKKEDNSFVGKAIEDNIEVDHNRRKNGFLDTKFQELKMEKDNDSLKNILKRFSNQ